MSFPRFFLSLCFFIAQNNYFGWNATAQSEAELIADGITLILISLSFVGNSK